MDEDPISTSFPPALRRKRNTRVISDEEWEAQKSNFKSLYQTNTLKRSMEIMEHNHGFSASERQYKRRIKKWGLDKNVKGEEMMRMAQIQLERKMVAGKPSSFRVRGREVGGQKIRRYVKRKEIRDLELLQEASIADSPVDFECYTPSDKSHSPPLDACDPTLNSNPLSKLLYKENDFVTIRYPSFPPIEQDSLCHLIESPEIYESTFPFRLSTTLYGSTPIARQISSPLHTHEAPDSVLCSIFKNPETYDNAQSFSPSSGEAFSVLERALPKLFPIPLSPPRVQRESPKYSSHFAFLENLRNHTSQLYHDSLKLLVSMMELDYYNSTSVASGNVDGNVRETEFCGRPLFELMNKIKTPFRNRFSEVTPYQTAEAMYKHIDPLTLAERHFHRAFLRLDGIMEDLTREDNVSCIAQMCICGLSFGFFKLDSMDHNDEVHEFHTDMDYDTPKQSEDERISIILIDLRKDEVSVSIDYL
ncbi:hypothetical protein B7463_g554, partial [Scytalidium lignicola]